MFAIIHKNDKLGLAVRDNQFCVFTTEASAWKFLLENIPPKNNVDDYTVIPISWVRK